MSEFLHGETAELGTVVADAAILASVRQALEHLHAVDALRVEGNLTRQRPAAEQRAIAHEARGADLDRAGIVKAGVPQLLDRARARVVEPALLVEHLDTA